MQKKIENNVSKTKTGILEYDGARYGFGRKMIEEFLLAGKKNAISSQRLADMTGCKSIRELQQIIAKERARGKVILSTCQKGGGYFLPCGDRDEVIEFIRTLQNRAKNTLCALNSAKAYLKQLERGE